METGGCVPASGPSQASHCEEGAVDTRRAGKRPSPRRSLPQREGVGRTWGHQRALRPKSPWPWPRSPAPTAQGPRPRRQRLGAARPMPRLQPITAFLHLFPLRGTEELYGAAAPLPEQPGHVSVCGGAPRGWPAACHIARHTARRPLSPESAWGVQGRKRKGTLPSGSPRKTPPQAVTPASRASQGRGEGGLNPRPPASSLLGPGAPLFCPRDTPELVGLWPGALAPH